VTQRGRLQQHVDLAVDVGDVKGGVAAERVITSNLELVARLLGTLVRHHVVRHT